jgi:hypothetical protein
MPSRNRKQEAHGRIFIDEASVVHRLRQPTANETVPGDDAANLLTRYARFCGR